MTRSKKRKTEEPTRRISGDENKARATLLPKAQMWILAYAHDRFFVRPLASGVALVVGREAQSSEDLVIDDPTLSRQHARFSMSEGGVLVEDLKSTNGVRIRGRSLRRATLHAGSEVYLGDVRIVLHGDSYSTLEKRPIGYERFRAAVEEEMERARYFERSFALILVRAPAEEDGHVSRFLEPVMRLLRPVDQLALFSHDTLEIVRPEEVQEAAEAFVRELRALDGHRLVVAMTVYRTGAAAVPNADALHEQCVQALENAAPWQGSTRATAAARRQTPASSGEEGAPVAVNAAMQTLYETLPRAMASGLPILLLGETGVGKEVVARWIHEHGERRGRPFVAVNCGAIAQNLVEAELFGRKKGAYTGATEDQPGLFEQARSGTLMLDEVGDLPLASQVALLRAIESRRIRPVGSTREVSVDVRIIAATNRDLPAMVRSGAFREDLYYRLESMSFCIPPLRERRDEIEPLCRRFLEQAQGVLASRPLRISSEASRLLLAYRWPGNVRELRNTLTRAAALCRDGVIQLEDLPARLRDDRSTELAAAPPSTRTGGEDGALPGRAGALPPLRQELERVERGLLLRALEDASGKRELAARLLGLPVRTFGDKLRKHGIETSNSTVMS